MVSAQQRLPLQPYRVQAACPMAGARAETNAGNSRLPLAVQTPPAAGCARCLVRAVDLAPQGGGTAGERDRLRHRERRHLRLARE